MGEGEGKGNHLKDSLVVSFLSVGGILSLFNITKETSGYYTCTSSNKIRSASCNITLTVMPGRKLLCRSCSFFSPNKLFFFFKGVGVGSQCIVIPFPPSLVCLPLCLSSIHKHRRHSRNNCRSCRVADHPGRHHLLRVLPQEERARGGICTGVKFCFFLLMGTLKINLIRQKRRQSDKLVSMPASQVRGSIPGPGHPVWGCACSSCACVGFLWVLWFRGQ